MNRPFALNTAEPLEPRRMLSAGDPDLSFGDRGTLSLTVGHALEIDPLPAGKTLLLANDSHQRYQVLRFNADGTPDTTFGAAGRVASPRLRAWSMVVDASTGRFIVQSTSTTGDRALLTAYHADGTLDTAFGNGGMFALPAFAIQSLDHTPYPIFLQPDGKVLAFAQNQPDLDSNDNRAVLYRVTTTGALDSSFGDNGKVSFPNIGQLNTAAIDPTTGKIWISGELVQSFVEDFNETSDNTAFLLRLREDGSLDTTFADHGIYSDGPFEEDENQFNSIQLLPDRSALIQETDITFPSSGTGPIVFHVSPRGSLFRKTLLPPDAILLPDGKLITVSDFGALSVQDQLTRYNADGTVDRSYGEHGIVGITYPAHPAFVNIAAFPDGSLVAMAPIFLGVSNLNPPVDTVLTRLQGGAGHVRADPGSAKFDSTTGALDVEAPDAPSTITLSKHSTQLFVAINEHLQRFNFATVKSITVEGSNESDTITIGRGVIGSYVLAKSGDDTIHGGDGNDTLSGGAGNDRIFGGAGNDRLNGDGDNDILSGDSGNDRLFGGNSNDWLFGGSGADHLYGQADDDYLKGDTGRDRLDGGEGSDHATDDDEDVLLNI